jgi:hypothetical protein
LASSIAAWRFASARRANSPRPLAAKAAKERLRELARSPRCAAATAAGAQRLKNNVVRVSPALATMIGREAARAAELWRRGHALPKPSRVKETFGKRVAFMVSEG